MRKRGQREQCKTELIRDQVESGWGIFENVYRGF